MQQTIKIKYLTGYIGPSISFFFADLMKAFHIFYIIILLLYKYLL